MNSKGTIEEILIRENEDLRITNRAIVERNNFLSSENNYLKHLIDKLLEQKKEGMKNVG